jgi:N-acetylmuramic acid 6-phosphate etherase
VKEMSHYWTLPTEENNPRTRKIDRFSILKILQTINREDQSVISAVRKSLPALSLAVKDTVLRLNKGGSIRFFGAGTSGRLGILEAAECPPTFGTPPALIRAFMAGGKSSVFRSKEGAEDQGAQARAWVRKTVGSRDIVVGIAASGVTPFVGAAISEARKMKALTILITCNPKISKKFAHHVIAVASGPEVIAGSTRLKAGTATKLILNSYTVATMIQMGKVYGNRMVDVQPRSRKLVARSLGLIRTIGEISSFQAQKLFFESGKNVKAAILMAKHQISLVEAQRKLKNANGHLHKILK